ncbi:hypothetical protein [Paracoccus pacificus]|uniref:Uncharacterized protein n=1 Tax=Paracoccus pacificus TaxID=1463598 RepID=A0ABW4R8F7_9RHOB
MTEFFTAGQKFPFAGNAPYCRTGDADARSVGGAGKSAELGFTETRETGNIFVGVGFGPRK